MNALSIFDFAMPPRLTVKGIQQAVAAHYGLPVSYMTSEHKTWDISHPRQVAMFLSRELLGKSYPNIGNLFGGRDHTTVLHAVRAVRGRTAEPCREAADIQRLRKILEPIHSLTPVVDPLLVAA